jgi:hypothetical protein
VRHQYLLLGKADKGAVTQYLMKVTGYSRAQMKRLIRQYGKTGSIKVRLARQNGFKRADSEADICLLAKMDERHGQPYGAVLKKLREINIDNPARQATLRASTKRLLRNVSLSDSVRTG